MDESDMIKVFPYDSAESVEEITDALENNLNFPLEMAEVVPDGKLGVFLVE